MFGNKRRIQAVCAKTGHSFAFTGRVFETSLESQLLGNRPRFVAAFKCRHCGAYREYRANDIPVDHNDLKGQVAAFLSKKYHMQVEVK